MRRDLRFYIPCLRGREKENTINEKHQQNPTRFIPPLHQIKLIQNVNVKNKGKKNVDWN